MSAMIDRERFARIALSFVAEPGDLTLGGMRRTSSPAEVFAAVCDGRLPEPAAGAGDGGSGQANGQGIVADGGTWYVVNANATTNAGTQNTSTPATTSTTYHY